MEKFMKRAIELAKLGKGFTNPNPVVGAVLVKDNKIISEGYHTAYGKAHAEVMAIGDRKELKQCTLYVTLEPCCHYGKTPPCTELIIESGLKHVVIATLDPNPLVSGKGVEQLEEAGISVVVGCLEKESTQMNEIFNHYIKHRTPFVILKYAMTLDGKIATLSGDSKWVTNELSRKHVHQTRQQVMGIMVGINTVLADDPKLTTRLDSNGTNPRAIILDSKGKIPLNSQVLKQPCIIATTDQMCVEKKLILEQMGSIVIELNGENSKVNLKLLMTRLGEMSIDSVLVEGGNQVHSALLSQKLCHKIQTYISPKLIGCGLSPMNGINHNFMSEALELKNIKLMTFGSDILVEGYLEEVQCLQD